MKEFRFKILEDGDKLQGFSEKTMVIKKENGEYHIYKVKGFSDGKPLIDQNFKLIIEKPETEKKTDQQRQPPRRSQDIQNIVTDEEDEDWADENE